MFSSGMPTTPYLYANDLVDTLKKKHAAGTYKSLVRMPFPACYTLSPVLVSLVDFWSVAKDLMPGFNIFAYPFVLVSEADALYINVLLGILS